MAPLCQVPRTSLPSYEITLASAAVTFPFLTRASATRYGGIADAMLVQSTLPQIEVGWEGCLEGRSGLSNQASVGFIETGPLPSPHRLAI